MKKLPTLTFLLAQLLALPTFAQFIGIDIPENGKNCSPDVWYDETPWTPPGQPSSAEHFEWAGEWITTSYTYYGYNPDGTVDHMIVANANGDLKFRMNYSYNSTGQCTEALELEYMVGPADWRPLYRDMYTYDSNGYQTYYEGQHYGFGQWYNGGRRTREYEQFGYETKLQWETWDDNTQSFDTAHILLSHMYYDTNGYPSIQEVESTSDAGVTWTPYYNARFGLYSNNVIKSMDFEYWDGTGFFPEVQHDSIVWHNFANKERSTYNYNYWNGNNYAHGSKNYYTNNNCHDLSTWTDIYDASTGTYSLSSEFSKTYDDDGTYEGNLWRYFDASAQQWVVNINEVAVSNYDGNGALLDITVSDVDINGASTPLTRSQYEFGVGLNELNERPEAHVYPSPANDVLNVDLDGTDALRMDVYSTDGKLVQSVQAVQNGQVQQLSTANITNGIYILAIQLDDGSALQSRFVVQH